MKVNEKGWYTIENIDTIDSPALLVYAERVKQNIVLAREMVKNADALRPHVKTNKISEVCKMMMDEGIYKFKCATIAEAEMLAMIGAKDVLIAYQPVGPKAHRLLELVKKYPSTHFSCLVDIMDSAKYLSQLFAGANKTTDVYIDLNTGMNRTGIRPGDAYELFENMQPLPAIKVVGLHAYDGHIRDTDVSQRQKNSNNAFDQIMPVKEKIESASHIPLTIVVGGTPTFPTHASRENVECSPGTFVFWDWGYKNLLPDEPFDIAALVITRVISIEDEQTICLDLGHKSVAAENPLPRVYFLNAPDAVPVAQSEEHLVVKVPDSSQYKLGDVLYGAPVHICPTVALYDKAFVIENNKAAGEWNVIARRKKINV